ncbi:MAG: hypothetical protein IANPNBLG_01581 [Bryobacteraceae bacterium]|nr:hypothetical protein [Bryobacteraceae bacterium]
MMEDKATAESAGAPPRGGCACMGAGPVISDMLRRLGPDEEVRRHFRAARIEFLKGIREIIDRRIGELSKETPHKGSKVVVE